jgi:hypothetical protein
MIEVKRVLPECFSDTLLVELILKRGRPGHRKGISNVVKDLIDDNRNHEFIIGIADTDKFKRENPNLKQFEIIDNKLVEEGLLILKKPGTEKHLIRIDPEFELWIWKIAGQCEINTAEFGFNSLNDLYQASKNKDVDQDQNMKAFINKVIQKNPPAIKTLREWLVKVLPPEQQEIILAIID